MPPGIFSNESKAKRSYERVFSDIEVYRRIGETAGNAIRFGETEIQARDYQLEAWKAISDARAGGTDSALVHLATGLGKTTVGVVDSLDFAMEFHDKYGRPPKIMFAVHQTEILDQAAARYKDFAPSLDHGYFVGRKKNTTNPLTFATMQSLSANLEHLDPKEFDYIIYDEAHHGQADTYKEVISHFQPAFKLGLTATPDRMDNKDIRDLFDKEVYAKPLAEAMTEGYLADVDYHIVFDDAVKHAMESGFTPETLSEIRELLNNESRNEEIALQIMEEMERIGLKNAKTIIFCQDVKQADEMAALLDGKAYHSAIDEKERAEAFNNFRNNSLQVITTRDMFNEGVDIPDARLLVFLRSTSSQIVFEQQLGRGLRKYSGKQTVSVLDFVANIERLDQIKTLADRITRSAGESGQGDASPGSRPRGGDSKTKPGLNVGSNHTDFDFDRISIALLDKMSYIREKTPDSIQTLAALWAEEFGNEAPTEQKIEQASKLGKFISARKLHRDHGGINALKDALGFQKLETMEEFATLWQELAGNEIPSSSRISEVFAEGKIHNSFEQFYKLGGVKALKEYLGFEVKGLPQTLEEVAELWKKEFGDEIPTVAKVNEASKSGLFMSLGSISRLGGLRALRQSLGFEIKQPPQTLQEAATLWKQNFGNEMPTYRKLDKVSKLGRFVSAAYMDRLGGVPALKKLLEESD